MSDVRCVKANSETWRFELIRGGDLPSEVMVEIDRDGHNLDSVLSAETAAAVIDALLDLLPEAARHLKHRLADDERRDVVAYMEETHRRFHKAWAKAEGEAQRGRLRGKVAFARTLAAYFSRGDHVGAHERSKP